MRIGKFYVFWEGREDNIVRFNRKLSRLDLERIDKYLDGGFHIHANPHKKDKKDKAPPLTAEELQNLLKETADEFPRHTPEELDRFIEKVREANSPGVEIKEE